MKLSKGVKILVGIGTAAYMILPFVFLAFPFTMAISAAFFGRHPHPVMTFLPFLVFSVMFPIICLVIILQFALMAFYLIHIIRNNTALETARILLGIGIFFLPFVAMPMYYYLFVWLDTPPEWALAKPTVQPPLPTPQPDM